MTNAQILVYDGFDELDAIAPFEILASAGFDVELVSAAEPAACVTTAHGLRLSPSATLAAKPELLVVPGGGWVSRAEHGAYAEFVRGVLPAAIAERHAAGSVVAGVCSGVMLLVPGGLLRGRPAVTHRGAIEELRAAGAEVHAEARVVDDGEILTAGGVTSALDLSLHLVERFRGARAAAAEAARIEYELRRPPLVRAPSREAAPAKGLADVNDTPTDPERR